MPGFFVAYFPITNKGRQDACGPTSKRLASATVHNVADASGLHLSGAKARLGGFVGRTLTIE